MKGSLCILSPSYSFVQKMFFKLPASAGYQSRHWESALSLTDKGSLLMELNSSGGGGGRQALTTRVIGAKKEHSWRSGDFFW